MNCIVCGKEFSSNRNKQKTCGSEECKKTFRRRNEKESRSKNRDVYNSKHREYYQERRSDKKYIEYMDKHVADRKKHNNKSALIAIENDTYRTEWCVQDEFMMLEMKKEGYSHKDISSKLKRTVASITYRLHKIRKDNQ